MFLPAVIESICAVGVRYPKVLRVFREFIGIDLSLFKQTKNVKLVQQQR